MTLNPKSQQKLNILVVDDDESILNLVSTLLKKAGYEITTAINCSLALKALEKNRFNLIITDAIMPMMSGFDFTRAIKRNPTLKDIPVLMLTKRGKPEDVKLALEAGVNDYLIKPVDEVILLDKVDVCLKKKEAKKHTYEIDFRNFGLEARVTLPSHVVSVSETGMIVRLGFPFTSSTRFDLETELFSHIGIEMPALQFVRSEQLMDSDGNPLGLYENRFSFLAVTETDRRKIRAWLTKESARFKK